MAAGVDAAVAVAVDGVVPAVIGDGAPEGSDALQPPVDAGGQGRVEQGRADHPVRRLRPAPVPAGDQFGDAGAALAETHQVDRPAGSASRPGSRRGHRRSRRWRRPRRRAGGGGRRPPTGSRSSGPARFEAHEGHQPREQARRRPIAVPGDEDHQGGGVTLLGRRPTCAARRGRPGRRRIPPAAAERGRPAGAPGAEGAPAGTETAGTGRGRGEPRRQGTGSTRRIRARAAVGITGHP